MYRNKMGIIIRAFIRNTYASKKNLQNNKKKQQQPYAKVR